MTLAALVLANSLFGRQISNRLKYASLGVLFVNVSIGGTLTNYAAPPVLMVAGTWGWDLPFMLSNFGGRPPWRWSLTLWRHVLFRKELRRLAPATGPLSNPVPLPSYWRTSASC